MKRAKLIALNILASVLGPQNQNFQWQCIWHHQLILFITVFTNYNFDYEVFMSIIDVIDYTTNGVIRAYLFVPSIASKNITNGSIGVFEDQNIAQIGIDQNDSQFNKNLIFWWGDLKTKVQMLSMQALGARYIRAYNRYQHIFLDLALWHL